MKPLSIETIDKDAFGGPRQYAQFAGPILEYGNDPIRGEAILVSERDQSAACDPGNAAAALGGPQVTGAVFGQGRDRPRLQTYHVPRFSFAARVIRLPQSVRASDLHPAVL